MADKMLNDTAKGILKHEGNELLCDSTIDDAAAFRGGAPPTQRTVVKYGGDVVMPDGRREEVGQLSFKQSEQHNVVDGRLGGEGYYGLRKPNAGSVDSGIQDIYRAYPENTHPSYPGGAFVFEVPVIAPNLGNVQAPSSGERTHDIWSPDGYSVTQMNDGFVDAGGIRQPGNFVTYGLARPWDKSRYMATFSSDTGPIPTDQRKWEGAPE